MNYGYALRKDIYSQLRFQGGNSQRFHRLFYARAVSKFGHFNVLSYEKETDTKSNEERHAYQ